MNHRCWSGAIKIEPHESRSGNVCTPKGDTEWRMQKYLRTTVSVRITGGKHVYLIGLTWITGGEYVHLIHLMWMKSGEHVRIVHHSAWMTIGKNVRLTYLLWMEGEEHRAYESYCMDRGWDESCYGRGTTFSATMFPMVSRTIDSPRMNWRRGTLYLWIILHRWKRRGVMVR